MPPSQFNPRPQITPPQPDSAPFSSTPVRSSFENRSAIKVFSILTLAAAGMAILLAFLPAVGHDQLWCLYVAQRLLHGSTLYGPELLESNPPLIMAMLLIPAALSHLLHLPITVLFKLGVLLTEFVTALLSINLLRRIQPTLTPAKLWSLAFAFITIFNVLPARDLGQRDHLLALLCLPYVLAAALDSRTILGGPSFAASSQRVGCLPLSLQVTIGLLAGLGICLKPHHALIPIFIEIFLIIKTRSIKKLLRPELLTLIATGIAFLAAIRLITPNYLTEIVPLLRDVYWAIGHLTFPPAHRRISPTPHPRRRSSSSLLLPETQAATSVIPDPRRHSQYHRLLPPGNRLVLPADPCPQLLYAGPLVLVHPASRPPASLNPCMDSQSRPRVVHPRPRSHRPLLWIHPQPSPHLPLRPLGHARPSFLSLPCLRELR